MIAVDESTVIKNYEAERTKFVNRVLAPLAEYRRILSGLPTPRSPLDLFSQFEFLSDRILGHKSYFSFKLHYAVVRRTDFGGKLKKPAHIVLAYRNQDELRRRIEPHSYRVEFRPNIPSTYSYREVPLTGKQKAIYAEMKKYATAQIEEGEHVTASLVIVQMLRLHQILMGYTIDETGKVHEIPENRTKALIDLLEEYNGKAIIWTSYDYSVRKIATALHEAFDEPMTNPDGSFVVDQNGDPVLENRVVARFWGGNANTREAEEKAFKEDPKCRFMVATPDSGGRGRTWDMADLVVYYGSKNNLEHREQSEQRPQNVGKERQVDYIDLIVPETVDGMIIKALRQKIDMATAITGDNYRQWLI
jgi:hypothetical protein